MTTTRAILKITGDRRSATITSVDDDIIRFDGNEEQALKISFCVPRFVGGEAYTISEGDLFERGDVNCFKIEDGAGMGNDVEIEFTDNIVQRVSVVWS